MKKNITKTVVVATALAVMVGMTGCGGNTDTADTVNTDQEMETDNTDNNVKSDATREEKEAGNTVSEGKEEEIDLNAIPKEIQAEFVLMDAMNQYMFSDVATYDANDAVSVWESVMIAAGESDWEKCGIEYIEDSPYISVPTEYIRALIAGLFAGKNDIPAIPEAMQDGKGDSYDTIVKKDEAHYYIGAGDRGLSASKIVACRHMADDSYEVTVELYDAEDEDEEICAFTYTLVANSDNAIFPYAISAIKPGDDFTEKRLSGYPYLLKDAYYGNLYNENDMTVREVMTFGKMPYSDTMYELNKKMFEDISSYDVLDSESWQEIRSYPFESDKYLQVVMTAITYPNYATDGEVYSYNYDIVNDKVITLDDACTMAGVTYDEIIGRIGEIVTSQPEGGNVYDNAEIEGFRIKPDDSIDVYVKVYYKNELASDNNQLYVYDMKADTLSPYKNDILIPDNTDDMVDMGLTHGVNEQ